MKGTSPYLVFAFYLATVLGFELLLAPFLSTTGLSNYRSEKISMLIFAALLIATYRLHLNKKQKCFSYRAPKARLVQQAIIFSILLGIAGIALIGTQVFLTAQLSENAAATLWNFTGIPGEVGFYDRYFGSKSGLMNLTLFASTQFIALPLVEEIYFKGIILERLLLKHSMAVSILITSILFSAAHDRSTIVSVFMFSVLTCFYYLHQRNIWLLVVVHGLGNFYDWLYSGLGGISFLESKHVDELDRLSTWTTELGIAVIFCAACHYFLVRISSRAQPEPSPGSCARGPDRA